RGGRCGQAGGVMTESWTPPRAGAQKIGADPRVRRRQRAISGAKPRCEPASTSRVSPVTWREAGEARKTAAAAISSGLDAAFSGVPAAAFARIRSTADSGMPLPNHGVSMNPGQMALTRILGASARASESVMVLSAPLEAAYGTDEPMPVTPAMEAVL